MSTLKVTPPQLTALGQAALRCSTDVRGQHQHLRGQLTPVLGADWSGPAAVQFASLYENFDQHARGLSDALDGIGALLTHAAGTYADAEAAIAASFR